MLTETNVYSSANHEPIVTFYDFTDNVVPPSYSTSTVKVIGSPQPTVKTLPPKLIKNTLPPKFKTVTLKAKVVKSELPPIGPAATTPTTTPTFNTTATPVKSDVAQQPVTYTTIQKYPPVPVTNTTTTTTTYPYPGPISSITYIYPPTPVNDFETFAW